MRQQQGQVSERQGHQENNHSTQNSGCLLYPPCTRPAHKPQLPWPYKAWSLCIWAGPCGRPSPPPPGGQTETGSQVPTLLAPSAAQPVPSPSGLGLWKAAEQFGWKDAVWVWGVLNTLHEKIISFQNWWIDLTESCACRAPVENMQYCN